MTPEEAADALAPFDTRRQAEEHFLERPARPSPPIDFSRVSARERARRAQTKPEGAAPMPKIRVSEVSRVDADTTRVVLEVDHRPGAERKIVGLGEDVAEALEDGKISMFEGMAIIAKAANL